MSHFPAAIGRATNLARLSIAGLLVLAAIGCGGTPVGSPTAAPTGSPGTDPTGSPSAPPTVAPSEPATPSPAPSASPSGSPSGSPSAGVVVTFKVVEEEYRILLTDATLIAHAQALLAGGTEMRIPSGLIVRGEPGVNAPWSWHIDPDSLEFADMTMEVCDGLPSHIEDGTLAGDRFCPWSAEVVAIEPAP